MYRIIIAPRAKKRLKSIARIIHKDAVVNVIEELKEDSLIGKKLTRELKGKYSFRVGVYRIIYKVDERNEVIYILTAGYRSKIYD